MVTWHLTMKPFPAKCHERVALRKLWRQTENSSLLPAKCWPLLHVIWACSWRWPDVAGISGRFSKFAFVLYWYVANHLMTSPLGNSEFCFPRISIFERLRFSENNIQCSPRDQSLRVKYFSNRRSWWSSQSLLKYASPLAIRGHRCAPKVSGF